MAVIVAPGWSGFTPGPASLTATSVTVPVAVPPARPEYHWPELDGGQWVTLGVLVAAPVVLCVLWFADVIRPGSLVRSGVRQVTSAPWWVWLAAGLLVYIAGSFVGMMTYASLGVPSWMSPPLKAQVIAQGATTIAGIAAGIAVVRMIRAGAGVAPDGLSLRWSDAGVGSWCFVVAYPVILAVSVLSIKAAEVLSGRVPEALAHETLKQIAGADDDPWVWGLRIAAVLLVPAFEELIYRAGLQSAILRATGKPLVAVVGATAVFTLAHVPVMPWHALAVIAVLSLAIGVAYERTRRLGVPIVMHALFNGLNVVLAMRVVG